MVDVRLGVSGGCRCGCGCYGHVVKWWMSVWVWMLWSCCEVVDVGVDVDVSVGVDVMVML